MNRGQIIMNLRPLRRVLVVAAEAVISKAFESNDEDERPPSKSQFSQLVNLCGEATCGAEIENYLRYQAGRGAAGSVSKREAWKVSFVKEVVASISKILPKTSLGSTEEERDLHQVEAWRLYATYMARAFTYEDAIRREATRNAGGRR